MQPQYKCCHVVPAQPSWAPRLPKDPRGGHCSGRLSTRDIGRGLKGSLRNCWSCGCFETSRGLTGNVCERLQMSGTFGDIKPHPQVQIIMGAPTYSPPPIHLGQSSLPKPNFSPLPAGPTCNSPLSSGLPPVAPTGARGIHITTLVINYADGELVMPSKARECCAAPEGKSHGGSTNDKYYDLETRGDEAHIPMKAAASELRAVPRSRPWWSTPAATTHPLNYSSAAT